jgi:hypothetical protein
LSKGRQRLAGPEQSPLLVKHRCIDEFVSALYKLDGAASNSVYMALMRKYERFPIFRIPSLASGDDNQIFGLQHIYNPNVFCNAKITLKNRAVIRS